MQKNNDKEKKLDVESTSEQKSRPVLKNEDEQETGGPQGPEPTRYGDWERKGRCVDF